MSLRVVVGVSGGGRSLENFLNRQSMYPYQIVGVIASRPDCRGVMIAKAAGLPLIIESFSKLDVLKTQQRVYEWLEALEVDLVALAGFLKLFPVAPGWERRVLNIHPALLPKYGGRGMYGHHVHAAVLAAGERESGATVHYVNAQYDEGAIIEQRMVEVFLQDTVESLAERVFSVECELYPDVISKIFSSKTKG